MYKNIFDPKSGKLVNTNSKKGRQIIQNYLNQQGGSSAESKTNAETKTTATIIRSSEGSVVYSNPAINELVLREEEFVRDIGKLEEDLLKFEKILHNYLKLKKGFKRTIKKDIKRVLKRKNIEKLRSSILHMYFSHKDEILPVFHKQHVCSNMMLKRLFNKLTVHYTGYSQNYMDVYLLLQDMGEHLYKIGEEDLWQTINRLIYKPIQHLPRYALHYKSIIKEENKNIRKNRKHMDRRRLANCQNVLQLILNVLDAFNQSISN